ncbi:MAG: hypothetical protein KC448_12425 [Yoonia sp.]|nr:hypothetical protein [Yoonia sp.]
MTSLNFIAGAVITAAGFMAPGLSLASIGEGAVVIIPMTNSGPATLQDDGRFEVAKRGRGGDDDHDDDRRRRDDRGGNDDHRDDNHGSGRDRPRVPAGSGCDDPEDLIEHAECRL